jgi:hypothetical protein
MLNRFARRTAGDPEMIPRPAILAVACAAAVGSVGAQQGAPTLRPADIVTLAKVHVAIGVVHDSLDAQLAQQRNKKTEIQLELKAKYREQVQGILKANGLDDSSYAKRTFLVSSNGGFRYVFDSTVVALTGTPIPGMAAAPPAAATVAVPPGRVGAQINEIVNAGADTPNKMGLLAVAMAEARTVIQHAQLASRQPGNLAYMKTHAGHVLNALDPNIMQAGPGLGYGLKRAATAIGQRLDAAAAMPDATTPQKMHAGHATASIRNVEDRAQEIILLAQKVEAATDAAAAASLINQIVSISETLIPGADANADGRVTWEKGEGGLQQCDEHIKLLLGGGM